MILQEIALQNLRSYSKRKFKFSPETTLIVGPNTAGKTNILEAIFMMATGKSFRAEQDREVVRWGEEVGRVIAEVANGVGAVRGSSFAALRRFAPQDKRIDGVYPEQSEGLEKTRRAAPEETLRLELVLTGGEVQGARAPLKKYLVNGVPRRMIDFVGNLRVVLFWPEHLELVTDSPSIRRKYLDSVLVQVDREYRRNLLSYERGLRQRNRLLDFINEGTAHRHQLLFWDQLLIKSGGYLTDARAHFIEFVNQYQISRRRQSGYGASATNFKFQIEYDKSVISEARLEQYKEDEVAAKATLVGPHRDDFIVNKQQTEKDGQKTINNKQEKFVELSKYGSRGEQRLATLWLKLAELSYIERETRSAGSGQAGERPVLLLDDIFSELDEEHRELVVELIGKQQTILTSADEGIIKTVGKNVLVIAL